MRPAHSTQGLAQAQGIGPTAELEGIGQVQQECPRTPVIHCRPASGEAKNST